VVGEVTSSRAPHLGEGSIVVGWATSINALSEYVISDSASLAEFDRSLEPTTAVLLQPLACVIYAVDQIGPVEGRTVAVLGQGPIGLLFSHVLKQRGASHVTGIDLVDRSDVASAFGVDEPVQASGERWASHLTESTRPSILVEAVGHQTETLADAIDAVAPFGLIYYFGIPAFHDYTLDLWKALRKQLTFKTGTTQSRSRYLEIADEYLRAHPALADDYVTHRYDISAVQEAFDVASVPAKARLKVVMKMS
jgi:threonine dehydrogenase-like Zn-dependent dehydrogenase